MCDDHAIHGPVPRWMAFGNSPDDPDEDAVPRRLEAATVTKVLAGFVATAIPGRAKGNGTFAYELVETDAGVGVRLRMPDDPHLADWGFLTTSEPHSRYVSIHDGWIAEQIWDIYETVPLTDAVRKRAADELAKEETEVEADVAECLAWFNGRRDGGEGGAGSVH